MAHCRDAVANLGLVDHQRCDHQATLPLFRNKTNTSSNNFIVAINLLNIFKTLSPNKSRIEFTPRAALDTFALYLSVKHICSNF